MPYPCGFIHRKIYLMQPNVVKSVLTAASPTNEFKMTCSPGIIWFWYVALMGIYAA